MTNATTGPDARAEALVAHYERAGYARVAPADPAAGRAVPRPLGRGHPPPHVSHHRSGRPRALPAPGPHHSGVARLSRLARRRRGGRLLLSRPGVPPSRRGAGRIHAGRHRILRRGATPRPPTPRCSRSGSRRPRITASPAPEIRMGDVGLFAALIAALDLAPAWKRRLVKDFNRTGIARARSRPARQRGGASSGPNIRACSPRWPAPTRRPRMRWSPTCSRSPASPRSADARVGEIADRFLEQAALGASAGAAARDARADRAVPRHQRRSGRGRRRAAHARAPSTSSISPRRSTCSKAAPASSPRAASMSRASSSRPRSGAGSITTPASCSSCTIRDKRVDAPAGRRRALRRAADAARRARADPGGRLCGVDRAARDDRGARHERAVRPRGAVQGPAAGERRGVLRARRPEARQAARRARVSRRDRRPARRRGRLSLGLRHHRAAGAGRACISASPART